jgi:hypothetical protein
MSFGLETLKIYFAAGQALFNDFRLNFPSPNVFLPGEVPNLLRLLHTSKYFAFFFSSENQLLVGITF